MTTTTLWRVELDRPLALLEPSVVELVTDGKELRVPYCQTVLQSLLWWRGQWIPVLRTTGHSPTLLVMRALNRPDCPYIALAMAKAPQRCTVTDRAFAPALPLDAADAQSPWHQCALSAVDIESRIVPIIDPALCLNEAFLEGLVTA
ncbi:hypothetical protein [Reinekea forsetii]|uniref:Chemotaxis signal transduction protein n=1 Tax=Reinekea forsetii TaxID=1336806 RepID=A0A2K8KSF9_9GAMM|nr:hypothetical protein [Reinekea forsetii]ATX77009.1 hypothetical protein REIFOR_01872 [Reinekea forsetii]